MELMSKREYGTPTEEKELQALAEVIGLSFGQSTERTRERFPVVGSDNLRVVRDAGKVGGGLWLVPMGQWFGGKSVPMTGIAAVGVAPEERGQGVALDLMNRTMEELHERKTAISTLYPAAQMLYRKAGYEQAGSRFSCSVAPFEISVRDHSVSIRQATEEDREAVREAYREYALRLDGHLDRGDYVWDRIFQVRNEIANGFVAEEKNRIVGYVYYFRKKRDKGGFDLQLSDVMAQNPRAGRSLLSFIADHRSMCPEASWYCGPTNPLLSLLPEQWFKMKLEMIWMTRIVNVEAALGARGYPPGIRAELHLEIHDDLLSDNSDRFVLEVEDGESRVTRGGKGRLAMDVRGLAPLFTGFFSPRNLQAADLVEGNREDLDAAAGVFTGPAPGMSDMF
jgi:predicted acetyltransferase